MRSTLILAVALFSLPGAFGATLSCRQLQRAYFGDLMNEETYKCSKNNTDCKHRQLTQLRETVKYFTEENVSRKTFEELSETYEPYFSLVLVGETEFEVVNIDLGDNSFLLYFDAGETKPAGIAISDGTLDVDGEYCKGVEFEPVINAARMAALCKPITAKIKTALPESTFSEKICTNSAPVDPATQNRTDVRVNKFNAVRMELAVQRNLHDVRGGYFSCKLSMTRKRNSVSKLKCDIK